MTVKNYKPSDPEFHEIAKTITPIHRVQNSSEKNTYIDEDISSYKVTRRENINTIR